MEKTLYEAIFKRKSFHKFDGTGEEKLTEAELCEIEAAFSSFSPLIDGIRVKMRIVKDSECCARGQEYCLYLYSEEKPGYLENAGYLGQTLDLYLVSRGIGTLWYGLGKPKETQWEGLSYVIMLAIRKVDDAGKFRRDVFAAKRKELADVWSGDRHKTVGNVARFAPSACNSQPWHVEEDENGLRVSRNKKAAKVGILPVPRMSYFNKIDMGIFLCVLDLCLSHEGLSYRRTVEIEDAGKFEKTAVYTIGEN